MKLACLLAMAAGQATDLMNQKPQMLSIQSQIDSLDATELGPAVNQNTNILTSLRQAGSILDGTSDIHKNVSAQSGLISAIKTDILTSKIPQIQNGLQDVRSALTNQQEGNRNILQTTIATTWSGLDSRQFVPFADTLRNQTIAVIRNISVPINEIENFDNQTTPSLIVPIAQADQSLNTTLTSAARSLQLVANQLEYLKEQLPLLTNTLEPLWENATQTDVASAIEGEYQRYISSSQQAVSGDAQIQVDADFNSTYQLLYSSLNQTRDSLMSSLQDATFYTSQMVPVDQMSTVNSEFVNVIGSIEAMLRDKLSVFSTRKSVLLSQIVPLVSGLGNTMASVQTQFNTLSSQMESQLNATRDLQYPKVDQFGTDQATAFANSLNSTYYSILNQAQSRLATVPTFSDSRLLVLNQTLENLLQRAAPRIADMQVSLAAIADQAQAVYAQTLAAVNKTQISTLSQIQSRVKSLNGDIFYRINTVDADVNVSAASFKAGMTGLANLITSSESQLDAGTDSGVASLIDGRTSFYRKFNSSVIAVRDVSSDNAVLGRVNDSAAAVGSVESATDDFTKQSSDFTSSFNNNKFPSVNTALDRIQPDSLGSSLRSQFNQQLEDAKNTAKSVLSDAVANYSVTSDSLDAQIQLARGLIEKSTNGFKENVDAQSQWTPQVDVGVLQSTVSALVDSATKSRLSVGSATDALGSEFSRNVSQDNSHIDSAISQLIAVEQGGFMKNISSVIDRNNALGAIADLLSGVKSQLSPYSDDGSQYRRMIQQAKDNIDSLDQDLGSAKQTLDPESSDLTRRGNSAVGQISVEFAKLADFAPRIVGDDSRITKFTTSMNAAIDQAVNDTKRDISNRLKADFFNTENSVQDYVNYVNGSLNAIQVGSLAERKRLSISALELRNTTGELDRSFSDGIVAAKLGNLKSIKGHKFLQNDANRVLEALRSTELNSKQIEDDVKANSLGIQSQFMRDMVQVASWLNMRASDLNSSVREDEAKAKSILSLRNGVSQGTIASVKQRAQTELGQAIDNLNNTELFDNLDGMRNISDKLVYRVERAHEVLQTVVSALNMTERSVDSETDQTYRALVGKLGAISTEVASELPRAIKSESESTRRTLHQEAQSISNFIDEHDFSAADLKQDIDKLYFVPMLGDMVSENRRDIRRRVSEIKKPKDFSSDINEIQRGIDQIKTKRLRRIRRSHMKN